MTPGPQDAFDRLLNQENYSENGGTGSARDYFRVSSYGQFNPQFDVVGPFTLPQDMSYYGGNDAYGDDKRPAYMVVDACQAAKASGVDFSIYDTNGDGYVDNVFIYYAGYNEAEYILKVLFGAQMGSATGRIISIFQPLLYLTEKLCMIMPVPLS